MGSICSDSEGTAQAPGESGVPLLLGCLLASPIHQTHAEKAGEGKRGCLSARGWSPPSQWLRTLLLPSLQWSKVRHVAGTRGSAERAPGVKPGPHLPVPALGPVPSRPAGGRQPCSPSRDESPGRPASLLLRRAMKAAGGPPRGGRSAESGRRGPVNLTPALCLQAGARTCLRSGSGPVSVPTGLPASILNEQRGPGYQACQSRLPGRVPWGPAA